MFRTQKEMILDYLLKNKTITSLECTLNLDIVDLQHYIMELRRENYNITDTWEQSKYNRRKKYKRYRLED